MFDPEEIIKESQQELTAVINKISHEKDKTEYKVLTNQMHCLNNIISNTLKYKNLLMK